MSVQQAMKALAGDGFGVKRESETTPCKACGGTLRYLSTGACVPCNRKAAQEKRARDKVKAEELRAQLENLQWCWGDLKTLQQRVAQLESNTQPDLIGE